LVSATHRQRSAEVIAIEGWPIHEAYRHHANASSRLYGRIEKAAVMQTIVNVPDSLYQKSEALAASRGTTVEQFIVEALTKEVQGDLGSGASGTYGDHEVQLPVIRSRRPGTLDLSRFDFDDLLT
jgi:hypothetical protein